MSEDAEVRSVNPYVESIRIGEREIEDLRQQLTAATALAEQAEAACGEMRQLLSDCSDRLFRHHEAGRMQADYCDICDPGSMDDQIFVKIDRALNGSAPGKSTADELRRLRAANERFANIARGILAGNEREIDSFLRRDCEEALAMHQPPRAERSE